MKTDIHPDNYRLVVFEDLIDNTKFLIKSTAPSQETIKWEDGNTYPLVKLHVTSASHPYYTGLEKMIDVEGRIDKFKAKQDAAQASKQKLQAKTAKTLKKQADRNQAQQEVFEADLKTINSVKNPKVKPKNAKESSTPQTKTAVDIKPMKNPKTEEKPKKLLIQITILKLKNNTLK